MSYCIGDNIISPLGETTELNYQAVMAGRSALSRYASQWQLPEPFTASLFTDEQWSGLMIEGMTRFESIVARSAQKAIQETNIDVASPRTVFILGTTKANIDLLQHGQPVPEEVHPGVAAHRVARWLGFTNTPLVACNACISGVAAIALAHRLLEADYYDAAVVVGADVQNRFTVSGFQSLKAVSQEPCRPFDLERLGLNLGESAATIVLQREQPSQTDAVVIEACAVRNDAFHVSSPSKNGEGAFRALQAIHAPEASERLAFINAHGTATMFNDQMESVAIERAGLNHVPVNGLKGYYGHTMGAAGVLETVISIQALKHHVVLGTRGFGERGVSGKIQLSAAHLSDDSHKPAFVKMISGFGGGNAALLVSECSSIPPNLSKEGCNCSPFREPGRHHHVLITPEKVVLDGVQIETTGTGAALLTELYKTEVGDYPKFFKMDPLARLAFIATELLLKAEGGERFVDGDDRAVVLFNATSSIAADRDYVASIDGDEGFYPSPSVFVYTLPNLSVGEIAMRNHYHGETSFYILPERDDTLIYQVQQASLLDPATKSMITGWIDYLDDEHFMAELYILKRDEQ
jgi:3-oxoacyl-[acyl-carrier-protein] synthase-1